MKTLYDLITAAEKTKAERNTEAERKAVNAYREKIAREKLVANTWASGAGILWDADHMGCEEDENIPLYTISILTDGTTLDKWYDNGCEGAQHVSFSVRENGDVVETVSRPYSGVNKSGKLLQFSELTEAIIFSIS